MFWAYWTTNRSSNGGTEAASGLIELARRIARGFTNYDNHRLCMLLIADRLNTHPKYAERLNAQIHKSLEQEPQFLDQGCQTDPRITWKASIPNQRRRNYMNSTPWARGSSPE